MNVADTGKQTDPSIVDENINPAKPLYSKRNHAPHLFQIANITNRTGNSTFRFRSEFSDTPINVCLVSCTNHHLAPLLQQAAGNRFSDPLRSTRNNRHLILDSVHEVLAFLFQPSAFDKEQLHCTVQGPHS